MVAVHLLRTPDVAMLWLVLLIIPQVIFSYTYPMFGTKRYGRSAVGRSGYIPVPVPVAHRYAEYSLPEYEDRYIPQDELEYSPDKYQYQFLPYYGYYSSRGMVRPKGDRRNSGGYGYYEDQDQVPSDPMDDLQEEIMEEERNSDGSPYGPHGPYGQEKWYEGSSKYDNNAEANAAFLQNLIIAQMYQDAAASAAVNAANPARYAAPFPFVYSIVPGEDYDDRNFMYGLPTRGVEETERAKEYFKNGEDEEVLELENLRKNKKKQNKQKDGKKNKNQKSKNKAQTEEELVQQMEREMRRNERKHVIPVSEGLVVRKKQLYPFDGKFGDFSDAVGKSVRVNGLNFSDRKNALSTPGPSSTILPAASTTTRTVQPGQKEVVLPRPATPVRPALSVRSPAEPSVYDTIKQLLSMEQDLRQEDVSRLQKRFVASEDQLTSELSGLKKLAA